ncbi:MAG: hypothetical protein HY652_04325 [Acidobacteria bacterium]|nr:hypothetical protein [Acidobacteriota bacterium]
MGGRVFVLGGYRRGDWPPWAEVYELDRGKSRWVRKSPMPTPRGALAVATDGHRIYAVAGTRERRPATRCCWWTGF